MVVDEVVAENNSSVSVYVAGRNLPALRAEPGQFFIWRFLTKDGWWEAHPFSVSAPPGDRIRMTVKAVGDFTSRVGSLQPGTRVIAEGPFGAFTARRRRHRRVVLVAAGAGIAPIRALFEAMDGNPGEVSLIYRASDESQLALRDEIDAIAAQRGAWVEYCVGSRTDAPVLDESTVSDLVGQKPEDVDVYICGPEGFTAAAVDVFLAAGVRSSQVHHERFELSR
jgi:ferredoxin-NADP reductase